MDSATSAAAQPPQGLHRAWHVRARSGCSCALNLVLFLAVSASFAGAAYRARHRPRDLAFVGTAYYLLALLVCCVAKLELLRDDPAAGDAQRRRARLATWAVSVALSVTFASRVADAMPMLPLKLAVWGITAVFLALGLYLLLCCQDADRRGAEPRRDQEDPGSQPAKASRELSPEEMA
ncbi:uncharacterized protein [Miscanthus floridulus]|uniref:uncharacterized protein n=1 Tax=Miscanthus floridulus TaxID=154761 RepID=UPI003459EA1E